MVSFTKMSCRDNEDSRGKCVREFQDHGCYKELKKGKKFLRPYIIVFDFCYITS